MIPYFAGNVFTIPSPDSGSIPFVPNVNVVLKFLQGKIGISEAFYKELLNENLAKISKLTPSPGGPEFGNDQPPSQQSSVNQTKNDFLNKSVTPPGVGLESIEILILRLFGQGFKPVLEMVLIILDLLKIIEDVICRLLGFVNPAYISWSLNACNFQLDLIKDDLNQPQVPNLGALDEIKRKLQDASNLTTQARAASENLKKKPNLNPEEQGILDTLEHLIDCSSCDINVLQKQLDVFICNLNNKPHADELFPERKGEPVNLNLDVVGSNIESYKPIKEAIYLGYYDRFGNPVDPPKWIKDSKKWKGKFEYLSSQENTIQIDLFRSVRSSNVGHDQFRKIFKKHLYKAAENVKLEDPRPYSDIAPLIKDGDMISDQNMKDLTNKKIEEEDCGCPPEETFSKIEKALDNIQKDNYPNGYKWIPSQRNTIDLSESIKNLKETSKNFDFVGQAAKNLDDYDFYIRNDKDEITDTVWNLAYNNPDASQIGHDNPIGVPDILKHKIMETYDIDPEMVGRIRVVKINNYPALPPGNVNLFLRSTDATAYLFDDTLTFFTKSSSLDAKSAKISVGKATGVLSFQYSKTFSDIKTDDLILVNDTICKVSSNKDNKLSFIQYGTLKDKTTITSFYKITIKGLAVLPGFRLAWNRTYLNTTSSKTTDILGSYRVVSFSGTDGILTSTWTLSVIPPVGWNTQEDKRTGTIFPGNVPLDIDSQLFLPIGGDPKKEKKYANGNIPYVVRQGLDSRDVSYINELYYSALGYNVIPGITRTSSTEEGLIEFNIGDIPTHYWLIELIPLESELPVTPTDVVLPDISKSISIKQQRDKDKYGHTIDNRGPYIYTQIPYFFTVIPVFFMGVVNIIVGRLVPLISAILEIILNPSKIGDLLGAIVQQRLGKDISLFAPDLTTDSSKVNAFSFLATQNGNSTTGYSSFGGRPIINTVIDGIALLVIPDFISFGFKVDKGRLQFVVQRAEGCKVDEPIIQLALSMITLPFQMMINIIKAIFEFLAAIAKPWTLPKAIIDFFSFKWLFGVIAPTNIIDLLGMKFKTDVEFDKDDVIKSNQRLHNSFSADVSQLKDLIINAIDNPNASSIDALRPNEIILGVSEECGCLTDSNIKQLQNIFPDQVRSFIEGDSLPLSKEIVSLCSCVADVSSIPSREVIYNALNVCGITDIPPVLGDGKINNKNSGTLKDKNGVIISQIDSENIINNNEIKPEPLEKNPFDRNACAPTRKNTLHYMTQFTNPPSSPPNFDLKIFDILGMLPEMIKTLNPSQFAFIDKNTSLTKIISLQEPQLIDLSKFIVAPFISNLPKVTPQELIVLTFLPIELLAAILKLFDGLINGIIAFVMGLFGIDGLFPIPKIKLHCLIPKFSIENGKLLVTERCEDLNQGLIFKPNKFGVSELFTLEANGMYSGMDISSFDGQISLSDGLYTGASAVNEFLNRTPDAKPIAAACGCDI